MKNAEHFAVLGSLWYEAMVMALSPTFSLYTILTLLVDTFSFLMHELTPKDDGREPNSKKTFFSSIND